MTSKLTGVQNNGPILAAVGFFLLMAWSAHAGDVIEFRPPKKTCHAVMGSSSEKTAEVIRIKASPELDSGGK